MSDINIPGITKSKYQTDKIIAGLVKTKQIELDRMQASRDDLELKRKVWQSINILTMKLEDNVRNLYNVDSPFRQKLSTSSDKSVLTVTSNRQAESGEHIVRVLQTAKADSLHSDEIANDYQVSNGNYTFGTGKETKSFTFNGGTLQQFVAVANRQLNGIAHFDVVNSRGQKQVLVFESAKSGLENHLTFDDQGKELALDIGLILDANSLHVDLLQESLISPFNELSNYSFSASKNEVSIDPGQELRISLPNSYTVRSGSVMRYDILAPSDKLPPISNTPDNPIFSGDVGGGPAPQPEQPEQAQLPEDVKNRPRPSGDASEMPPPSAAMDNNSMDNTGRDEAVTDIDSGVVPANQGKDSQERALVTNDPKDFQEGQDNSAQTSNSKTTDRQDDPIRPSNPDLLKSTANFYFVQQGRRIAAGRREGEVQAIGMAHEEILSLHSIDGLRNIDEVVIRNPNPGRKIIIRNLRFENAGIKTDYLATHPISTAQNAIISYLGVEMERPSNNVDDLLPGLSLNLKQAKPEEEILIRTEPAYEAITQRVADFVNSYNDLMTQLNIVGTNNEIVIREKTAFTDKQREEAREVLGLLQSDSNVANLKYRLTSSVADGYPTGLGTQTLSDVGISTNLSGLQGSIYQNKLRGYLEFDTEIFQNAMEENFEMVKDIFGRDNDGDYTVDSGSALEIQRISNGYTQAGGPIPHKVKDLERNIDDSERRISDYKNYLLDYEDELKLKYGRMEGTLNQLERQQQSLKNFSDSMNR